MNGYRTLLVLTVALFPSALCMADKQTLADAVAGVWASSGTVVEIAYSAEGTQLTGTIIAMKKPRPDRKHPDAQMRTRPLIGTQLLSDTQFGKDWRGRLYDPTSGRTWRVRIRVEDDGRLAVRGYIGVVLLGRTEHFLPVSTCRPHIVAMLDAVGRAAQFCPEGAYAEPAS